MRSCMFFLSGWRVNLTVYIIHFLRVSVNLLGVCQKVGSSSLFYPAKTGMVGFLPILFIFTRCISTPWIFDFSGFSSMSDMEIYLRYPLRSWGYFSLLLSPTFLEESLKWSENFLNRFRVICRICPVQSLRGSPLWSPSFLLNYRPFGGTSFCGFLIIPKFSLVLRGSLTFLEGLFCSREHVPGSLLPAFSYCCLLTKKISNRPLPFYPKDLRLYLYFLDFCEEERMKIEVIE